MNPDTITCPLAQRPSIDDWASIEAHLQNGPQLNFHQAWETEPHPGLRPANVRVAHDGRRVLVLGTLGDDELHCTATASGQNMWELGDVFEIFFRQLPEEPYYEFHCTPNGHNLQLRWPSASAYFDKVTRLAEAKIMEPLFDYRVRPVAGGWQVYAELDVETLFPGTGALAGHSWLMSFSRYDCDQAGSKPVLSSTSRHQPFGSYHRQEHWTRVDFV